MQISLMVEGQAGVTWDTWKALVSRVEEWGFAGLYRSDHFTNPFPPNENSLEMMVSLAYVADHTARAHFGPLVAPFSFREPVMLARQAAHIDALSKGRMILGVGAGWMQREHEMFGYALLDKPARMERFAEGLQVVWSLLKSDVPVSFDGKYYKLREAEILPRPHKTRILVGGNGVNRTLRLVAKYADVWNGVGIGPQKFSELAGTLDSYLVEAGRPVDAVKKTLATFIYFGRDRRALEERIARVRSAHDELKEMPHAELVDLLRKVDFSIAGLADEVIPQIRAYADAGVEELMLQILDSDDLDGLNAFAEQVMPHVA
jgi:alkanesulfonate monooxygenase SsuD/methylene tetrahydromethanopterin reductase-like flavin-dependent oxidoreductase (luciferase family)